MDFLVEFEGATTFDRYMDLKFFLEDLFDLPVDLVTKRSLKKEISQKVLHRSSLCHATLDFICQIFSIVSVKLNATQQG